MERTSSLACFKICSYSFVHRESIEIRQDTTITYRLTFETRRIVGNDAKVGDYASVIQLVILDLKGVASLVVRVTCCSSHGSQGPIWSPLNPS